MSHALAYAYAPEAAPRPVPLVDRPTGPLLREVPATAPAPLPDLDRRDPRVIEAAVRFTEQVLFPYHRATVSGLQRVPPGAALYVGNHSGGSMTIDGFLLGAALYRAHGEGGLPFILAHDFALRLPGFDRLFPAIGAVRATRKNADRLFEAGHKVMVYPGGADEAMRPFRDRDRIRFGGKTGYVRTAIAHGVPVVPVVSQGSHAAFIVLDDARWAARLLGIDRAWRLKSWGIVLSVPWGLTLFPPPAYLPLPTKIQVEVLDPIRFARAGQAAARDDDYVRECAALVEGRMQEALDRLAGKTPAR